MLLKITAAAAAFVAATALAGAASAQSQSGFAGDSANPTGAVQTDTNAGPAAPAPSAGSDANAARGPSADTSGYNVGAPQTDASSGAQIVTNGPVPDTRANRARFGTPDSHAGKRTSAAGN